MVVGTFETWQVGDVTSCTGYRQEQGSVPCVVLREATEAEWLAEVTANSADSIPSPEQRKGAHFYEVSTD